VKKKLYALANGRKPGIYYDWLEFYKKILDIADLQPNGKIDYEIFVYDTDLMKEDTSVEHSFAWANMMARRFLGAVEGDEADVEAVEQEDEEGEEYEFEYDSKKESPFEQVYDERTRKKMALSDIVMETNDISNFLKRRVIGQDSAIEMLEKAYFHNEKDTSSRKGPKNVFFFAGPPGVGKTFTAELFAQKKGLPYKRFDMSAYASRQAEAGLVGFEKTWRDAVPGTLTEFVKKNPKCVLLFDEIEKAYVTVVRIFLQILDDGRCIDKFMDEEISFKDCIIFFTTNAGKQLYVNRDKENLTLLSARVIVDALEKDKDATEGTPLFPPELLSRLSSHTIIMFNHLKSSDIRRVIQADIRRITRETRMKYSYFVTGTEKLAATAQYSVGGSKDARNASKIAGKILDEEIFELLLILNEKRSTPNISFPNEIRLSCDLAGASDEIVQFYKGERDGVIALFGDMDYLLAAAEDEYEEDDEYDDEYDDEVGFEIFEKNNVSFVVTSNVEEFRHILDRENVLFSVIDFNLGRDKNDKTLSILDANGDGHDMFFEMVENHKDIPVYIIDDKTKYTYTPSEYVGLRNAGAMDFIDSEDFCNLVVTIYNDVCCDRAVDLLSSRHQVMRFDTRQEYNEQEHTANIIFYNLRLENAVDAEDKGVLLSDDLRPNKHWDDIYVSDDVKNELKFFVDYLSNPKAYGKMGVAAPRGALMYGPPGTGKTSLAKVVATESGVNFLAVSGDQLAGRKDYVVHDLFRTARKYAPAVLFIDEIDAVGISRNIMAGESALNALLTEMDGFTRSGDKPVFVMAATNLQNQLDPALQRRFDRNFFVDLPKKEGREWILRRLINANNSRFDISDKEIESLVIRSNGMSPATLEKVVELALRESIRAGRNVDDAILDDSFEKLSFGERNESDSNDEILQVAYHEAGHAIIQLACGRVPEYMSVVSRGDFGGYVLPEKVKGMPTKEELLDRICITLGGRASEMENGYGITPGAGSDLEKATESARKMVCEYGMYEDEVGIMVIPRDELKNRPDATKLINRILSEQLSRAREIVAQNSNAIKALVEAVMGNEKKYLTRKDMDEIWRKANV
jgi:ATP-dependent Zn protease